MDLAVGVAVGSSMVDSLLLYKMTDVKANCTSCGSVYCIVGMDDKTTHDIIFQYFRNDNSFHYGSGG